MGSGSNYGERFHNAGPAWVNYLENLRVIKQSYKSKLSMELGDAPPSEFGVPVHLPPLRLPTEPVGSATIEVRTKAEKLRTKIQKFDAAYRAMIYEGD
jgi:hypothetical protein